MVLREKSVATGNRGPGLFTLAETVVMGQQGSRGGSDLS